MKEKIAQILRDNITFSSPIGGYHGAVDEIEELLKQERDKAIDACVATLKRESELYNAKIIVNALYEVSLILEALKS